MRPLLLAALVLLGLAAAGAAFVWPTSPAPNGAEAHNPARAVRPATLALHADTTHWAVARHFNPGARAIRIRFKASGRKRGDTLTLRVYDRNGHLRHRAPVKTEVGKPGRVAWDGILAHGEPLEPGAYDLQLELRHGGAVKARSERLPLTVLNLDLDVDTDRDGVVTAADEKGEDDVSPFAGAYFAVNFDADGERRDSDGQLLPDSLYFDDLTGHPIGLDDRIENDADGAGLAPLVIRGFGAKLLPDMRIYLRVAEREDIESIQIYPGRKGGTRKIWGGLGSREGLEPLATEIDITRYVDPESPDYAGSDDPSGAVTFAVEGLFFRNDPTEARKSVFPYPVVVNAFDGDIDLYLEIRHADEPRKTLYSDHVRMRVVPWLMVPPTNRSVAVFARDAQEDNAVLINAAEEGYAHLEESGQLVLVGSTPHNDDDGDLRWLQDHAVLGAYHLPGTGPEGRTYAALRLPYEVEEDLVQPKWVAQYLTGSDRGVFQFGSWLGNDHGADDRAGGGHGGNIDVIPPSASWPLGRIVAGDTMPGGLRVFLASQRVQPPVILPTRWLAVGHIDEMFGFTGQGGETLIADPLLAYRLLEAIPEKDRGAAVFFAKGGAPVAGIVREAATKTTSGRSARRLDTGIDHRNSGMRFVRIYADSGSRAAGQVARIAPGGLRNGYVLIDHVWETATRIVPRAADEPSVLQFIGIDDDTDDPQPYEDTKWFDVPRPGDRFVMVRDSQFWFDGAPAFITVEEVLADRQLRLLNTQNIAARISSARKQLEREGGRNADGTPFLTFKSVPVIYAGRAGAKFVNGRSAAGMTPNLANFQVIGEDLYMPRQFGPLNENGEDIFEKAVREALGERVRFVDTWDAYHRQFGEVHCATNVLRKHFDFDWWTRISMRPWP